MKTILTKFHLNITTYLYFLVAFLCGYFKQTILIFLIVFLHECGHVITIRLCKYKIINVELYPFGGITKIDKPINSSIHKEMLISVSGIFMQLVLYVIYYYLYKFSFILDSTYQTFLLYNTTILFFNCIPMIPLDGSVFLHSLLEKICPYTKALFLYKIVSIIVFIIFCVVNYLFQFDNYFICIVLFFEFLSFLKEEKHFINRFYLERYLNKYPAKKIENHYKKDLKVLKKETEHFFYVKGAFITEKELLSEKFS